MDNVWQKLEREANKQANMDSIYCTAYVTVLLKPTLHLPGVSLLTNPVSLDLPALASKSATASLLDIKDAPLKEAEIRMSLCSEQSKCHHDGVHTGGAVESQSSTDQWSSVEGRSILYNTPPL